MGWTDGQTDRERRNGVRPGHLHQQTVLGPGWTELSGLKRKRERHTASLETWKRSQHGMLLDIESHCRLLLGNQSTPPPPHPTGTTVQRFWEYSWSGLPEGTSPSAFTCRRLQEEVIFRMSSYSNHKSIGHERSPKPVDRRKRFAQVREGDVQKNHGPFFEL